MAPKDRDKNLNVRVSDEELQMLAELAEHDGLTVSDWLRQTFRKAYRRVFGVNTPAAKAKSGKRSD